MIQYTEVDGGVFISIKVAGDQRGASITGLKPSTLYDIQIAAVNSVGTGPFTSIDVNASTSGTNNYLYSPESHDFLAWIGLMFIFCAIQPCPLVLT